MSKARKGKSQSGDLTVAVVMTVHADADRANTASYSVVLDVDGPEVVVGIVRAAYQMGALNRGIDAFIASVARSIGPQPPMMAAGKAGRS